MLNILPPSLQTLKKAVQKHQDTLATFNELKTTIEETRKAMELGQKSQVTLTESVAQAQREAVLSAQRAQTLKVQAEKRLKESNEEMMRIKDQTETQIYITEMRLRASEARAASLTERTAIQEKENTAVLQLCDSMLLKLEQLEKSSS